MRSSLLPGEPPFCPVCEGPCKERFRRGSWRIGDPMPDHPTAHIPDRDVYEDGMLVYPAGAKMPYSEAVRLGVIVLPEPVKVKRGRRKQRPVEDRMIHGPVENRS